MRCLLVELRNKSIRSGRNKEAKSLLEGIWLDDNTETALLRVKGDTLFYADAATAPVAFKIIGDSLITYGARTNGYKIEKQGEHIFGFIRLWEM